MLFFVVLRLKYPVQLTRRIRTANFPRGLASRH